ncbi:aldose 1-epimerase family protein [Aestuariimicrobium ganziense]|uniref:aldose 1-epimerase family protein n=1 Tax=Aestuariimicrobium ganziense TaxID=2773677 RepID=UPI001942A94E|nr:aldose 1-epimerase family protein [Aestuariimicrobium ganziense]
MSEQTPQSPCAPTGEQYEIVHGDWRAVVTEQGATLRSLTRGGREVALGFGEGDSPVGCQGQHLLPWPNRIRDGRYTFDGQGLQLAISEPERNNAIHGLVNWRPWQLVSHEQDSVTQRIVVLAEPGWPGVIEATITHRVDEHGLQVQVTVRNTGSTPVPYGYAAHPYLKLDAPLDEWTVEIPFDEFLVVDERLLPIEVSPVAGAPGDFTTARTFGGTTLDTAFRGVRTDQQGRWMVRASHGDDRVGLWSEQPCTWLQVYTPDDRASLAVEPMTCGPDAFNEGPTHADVIRLESGEEHTLRWGIEAG